MSVLAAVFIAAFFSLDCMENVALNHALKQLLNTELYIVIAEKVSRALNEKESNKYHVSS